MFELAGDESCFEGVVAKIQQHAFGSPTFQGNQNQKYGVSEGKGPRIQNVAD